MNTKLLPVAIAIAALLSACSTSTVRSQSGQEATSADSVILAGQPAASIGQFPGATIKGSSADANARASQQLAPVVLRRSSRPWVAGVTVPMGSGEALPSIFGDQVVMNFDDPDAGGRVSLRTVADRITAQTGVPVRITNDVFNGAGAQAAGAQSPATVGQPPGRPLPALQSGPIPMPSTAAAGNVSPVPTVASVGTGLDRQVTVNAVAMKWRGTLEGYLNNLTDLLQLSWEYRDGVVVIERYKTEFFEVALLDSEQSYSMGINANDSTSAKDEATSSQSNAMASVKETGKSDPVKSVIAGVQQIIGSVPGSAVVQSSGSGRIAVTTTKDAMTKVRQFVRGENEAMLRQAQIQFDIYSVKHNDGDERGLDWGLILNKLGTAVSGGVTAPSTLTSSSAGNVALSILSGQSNSKLSEMIGGSKAMINLLSTYGTAVEHKPVSLLTLNRQWARKANVNNKAYVSESVPSTSSTGTSTVGLKTSTVTTGDRYLVQPSILDNSTVVLKFGIGLSSLVDIVNFTSGNGVSSQTVQTPETNGVIDQATIALKAGQVLAITGLSRVITSDTRRTLTEDTPVGLGGSTKVTRVREDFIILVRPTILLGS